MFNPDFNIVDSILVVKASGSLHENTLKDLDLPEGKPIAELLNDQKEEEATPIITE